MRKLSVLRKTWPAQILFTSALIFVSANAAGAELTVSASATMMSAILTKVAEPFSQRTGIQLTYTQKNRKGANADEIFEQVDKSIATIGFSSITWEDWVDLMNEKGYKTEHLGVLHTRMVGSDVIDFITFPGGPKILSIPQLKELLLGKIKNWRQVGGPDLKVVLVHTPNQPGLIRFLENHFLAKTPVNLDGAMILARNSEPSDVVAAVAKSPGAFGVVGHDEINMSVNVTEHPQIGRPITAIFLGKPTTETEKLFDFIKNEAEKFGVKVAR